MPKPVRMMVLAHCPYCHKAFGFMEELRRKHPEYEAVAVEVIDEAEQPELADTLDYYYVPTFFVGDQKIHEGDPTLKKVERVYQEALKP